MIDKLPLIAVPAIIALMVKIALLIVSRDGKHYSRLFLTLVAVFACHNVAEVLSLMEFSRQEQSDNIVRWYFVFSIVALGCMVAYAIEVSKMGSLKRPYFFIYATSAFVLAALVLATDHLIAGVVNISYSPTAERGDFHWAFVFFTVCSYTLIIALLLRGYKNSANHITQIRCGYTLLALAPIVLAVLIPMLMMNLGYPVNSVAIIPMASTLFLLITLASERAHQLTDIRRFIPGSIERNTSKKIMQMFSKYANDEASYRESLNEIERLLITHKHDKKGNVVSHTAEAMDVPRSSLYSIVKRLDLELKDSKEG